MRGCVGWGRHLTVGSRTAAKDAVALTHPHEGLGSGAGPIRQQPQTAASPLRTGAPGRVGV